MPRHYRQHSLQKILIETVLFVSLFTLIGHLSVNFWERYMIQSEITKIKSSLYAMKDTINSIGVAYDDLHNVLIGLSVIVEQKPMSPVQQNKPKSKNQSTLDRKIVNDLEIQVMDLNKTCNEQKIGTCPFTVNQTTQNFLQEFKMCKNATTIAKCLHRRAKVRHDMETSAIPTVHHKNEEAVRVIPEPGPVKNATTITRYPLKSTAVGKEEPRYAIPTVHHKIEEAVRVIPEPEPVKNATTITRYPLKCTTVGKEEPRYEELCRHWNTKENRCCDDDNCKSDFWRF